MSKKLSYRDIGMDVMERLYHERKEARQKAYIAKRKQEVSSKRLHITSHNSLDSTLKQSICTMY